MTASAKKCLHQTIARLSEEECHRVLEFVQSFQQASSNTLKQLSEPTFRLPTVIGATFQDVDPIHGEGTPASRLLLEDRR